MFEENFGFSLVVFFVHMLQFHLSFTVFHFFFWIGIFLNGFLNPFIVPSRPSSFV